MKNKITFYDILGIEREAGIDDIKKAYRMLAKADHPDINGGIKSANKRMALLNKAYEALIDPDARREYDEQIDDIDHYDYTRVYEEDQNGYQSEPRTQKKGSWWTVIFIVLIIFGYQIFLQMNNNSSNTIPATKASSITEDSAVTNKSFIYPTAIPEPTIDCTGPDGKHLYTSFAHEII